MGFKKLFTKKERNFLIAILVFVAVYLYIVWRHSVDPISKTITTVIALISAVTFWMQLKRSERLNESSFIMNLNNQFIGNKNMVDVEHALIVYFDKYQKQIFNNPSISDCRQAALELPFQLNLDLEHEDRQKLINYLVYLESFAAIVDNDVLHLEVIDDLFSYRFFLAVNNPIVQETELIPYADFYRGCHRLCEHWTKHHEDNHLSIPMNECSLSKLQLSKK